MARRVFLHIGPPKTGTTFLQAAWFQHRRQLADQGVLYPGGHLMDQFRASAVVLDKTRVTERMSRRDLTSWQRLSDAVRDWDGDAILSSEHYAIAKDAGARGVLAAVGELADEVHLVVTARDLARLVPAAWQQSIKQGNDQTFDDYWRGLADNPQQPFWRAQDLPRLLDRWAGELPPERVHVVVHGRPGSPSTLLWERMCAVTGVDPAILGQIDRSNESLGVVQVEFLRRVNTALPADRDRMDMGRMTKNFVTKEVLAHAGPSTPLALPEEARAWFVTTGDRVVAELAGRGYDVVGDLADLRGDAEGRPGRTPESVSDADVAAVAAEAFARMMVHELDRRRADRARGEEPPAEPTTDPTPAAQTGLLGRLRRDRRD